MSTTNWSRRTSSSRSRSPVRAGRAGLGDVLAEMFAGFPDLRWDVQETVVEADRVASVFFWTGTHQGVFLGIPTTGRRVRVEAWPSTASATVS